jgi:hypothetical protein
VQRDVTREAVQSLGHAEQQLELAGVQVGARELGQALDRDAQVLGADVREGLGDDSTSGSGAQGLAHSDGGARGTRHHRDARAPSSPKRESTKS